MDLVRDKVEDQIFQMRLQGAEVEDPDWLEEEKEKPDFSDIRKAFEQDKERYSSMLSARRADAESSQESIGGIAGRQSRLMSGTRPRGGILNQNG